jgi:translation elongation factor EF-G
LFRPDIGNVAFASGYDCWSFTLPGFIPSVAQKVGMNPRALLKFMWDQYYFDPASKAVSKIPPSNDSKEMFVQFIMDPLVERYKKFFNEDIIQNTALVREAHTKIKEKFSKLMPMEDGVLKMVCDHLPAPCDA